MLKSSKAKPFSRFISNYKWPPIFCGLLCSNNFSVLAQGYKPSDAIQKMTVADGFTVNLVASEPMIAQPVCIEFDDRGRLWVIQYLQYPNPSGLNRAKVDRFSRTIYDKVPEPPPRGPKGADRITILSDFDKTGRAQKSKDFLIGLNLASGLAFGHGGVFVLQVPYLLLSATSFAKIFDWRMLPSNRDSALSRLVFARRAVLRMG